MRKNTAIGIMVLTALMFSGSLFVWTEADGSQKQAVTVQRESSVAGDDILLGDIATIQGDLDFIQLVEKIVIGRAPFIGSVREIKKGQILVRFKQNDVSVKNIEFSCPRKISVTKRHQEVSAGEQEALCRAFIYASMPWKRDAVAIGDFDCKPVMLSEGHVTSNVVAHEKEDFTGRFTAEIHFYVNGSVQTKVSVSTYISVFETVAVSTCVMERDDIVTPGNIIIQKKDISRLSRKIVRAGDDIIGKRVRVRIQPGSILKQDMFEETPVVRKGDRVTIVVENDFFRITTPGEVLEDGRRGEMIRVCNIASKKKIYGIVHNEKEVGISY